MDRTIGALLRNATAAVLFATCCTLGTAPAVAATTSATATAVLVDPSNHNYVGTVVEDCRRGQNLVTVFLNPTRKISGTEELGIEPANTPTFVIGVSAQGGVLRLHSFGGISALGCLPSGTTVMLVFSPGGDLQTLLTVVGKGTIALTK